MLYPSVPIKLFELYILAISLPDVYFAFCQSSAELVKEITNLEGEIIYLERYILSLYRAAFEQHIPSSSGGSKTSSQNKSDTESRNSSDKCCLGLEPKLCKDSPDYYNQSLPFTRNVANLDDQKYAATPKSSCKKVSKLKMNDFNVIYCGKYCIF